MNYTVSTSGTGLVVRCVDSNDTTVYADCVVAEFSDYETACRFAEEHDEEYWEDAI